jgi:hypothetical protein
MNDPSQSSSIVYKWWKKKFKREPQEAQITSINTYGTNSSQRLHTVMVRDLGKFQTVLVITGGGKAQRIFLEQD